LKDEFDEIAKLAYEIGVLDRPIAFEEYADPSFCRPLDELDWNMNHLPPIPGRAAAAEGDE
jgi:hypothetical protein